MAGIYDRINPSTVSAERTAANLLHAAFVLRAAGKFNDTQIINALNQHLTSRGGTELTASQLTDLSGMAAVMDAKTNLASKLAYAEVIRAAFITVEMGLMEEIVFNSTVELSA